MKMQTLVLAGGFLALSLPVWGQSAHVAAGTITQNGKTLELKSAVAVWSEEAKALVIGLFPFEVDDRDVSIMVSDGAQALAALKPSPDPAIWERTPVAALCLEYKKRPKNIELKNLQSISLRASGLDESGQTFAVSRRTKDQLAKAFAELGGAMEKNEGDVKITLAGSEQFIRAVLNWDFHIESPVHWKER